MNREEFYSTYVKETTFHTPIMFIPNNTKKIIEELSQEYTISENYNKQLNEIINNSVIYIYPILIKDYFEFNYAVQCLEIDRDKLDNIKKEDIKKVLKMEYLDFLYYLIENSAEDKRNNLISQLIFIVELCFKIQTNNKLLFIDDNLGRKKLKINDNIILDFQDFDTIKSLILYQNFIDHDETSINADVKEEMEKVAKIQNRNLNPPTFEKMIHYLAFKTNSKTEELYEWTIRKFFIYRDLVEDDFNYKVYMQDKNFKDEIQHPLYAHKDKFANVLLDYEEFKKPIEQANG